MVSHRLLFLTILLFSSRYEIVISEHHKQAPMKRLCTILFFMALITLPCYAQVTFIAPSKNTTKGDIVSLDIRVKAKDTVSALQFTLEWNPLILEFKSAGNLGVPTSDDNVFGLGSVTTGALKFLWLSSASEGNKLEDSLVIFKVNFKTIGAVGTSSAVKFTNSLFKVKALRPNGETISITTQEGLVSITTASATGEIMNAEGDVILKQNTPNPVANSTIIPFEIKEAQKVSLEIYDSIGRKVYQKEAFMASGQHQIEVDTEGVMSKGIYVYGIRTLKGFLSRTMIKM